MTNITPQLLDAITKLRAVCNSEISIATHSARGSSVGKPAINPDVPFHRVNDLLRACDDVFRSVDEIDDFVHIGMVAAKHDIRFNNNRDLVAFLNAVRPKQGSR